MASEYSRSIGNMARKVFVPVTLKVDSDGGFALWILPD
jgi:hypothetical protein